VTVLIYLTVAVLIVYFRTLQKRRSNALAWNVADVADAMDVADVLGTADFVDAQTQWT